MSEFPKFIVEGDNLIITNSTNHHLLTFSVLIVLIVLTIFLLIIFLPKPTEEAMANLSEEVNRKESVLKNIDTLYKEWNILIEKRSQALKEMDLDQYRAIDKHIDLVKRKIQILIDDNKKIK